MIFVGGLILVVFSVMLNAFAESLGLRRGLMDGYLFLGVLLCFLAVLDFFLLADPEERERLISRLLRDKPY
jgi:hypothetical protein